MSEMDAIVMEFVEEGGERIRQLESWLLQLEKDPNSSDLLVEIFRALHSIKGATSFLGFSRLCALAHDGEALLAQLRDGTLVSNPEVVSALLSLVDAIREMLAEIASTGQEGATDYTAVASTLARLRKAT